MILHDKNAIIYGAAGSLGGAVATALAAAGAKVFLTGRNIDSVQKIADNILEAGGKAEADQVDAMNEEEISNHIDAVKQKSGSVDISFNAVGIDVLMNIPLAEMSVADYVNPITKTMQTRFLTAKAAAKIMIEQRSGVIVTLTATPGGIGYPYTGGFAPACCAVENLSKNLALELGIYGIRVINIRSGGSPDSSVFKNAIDNDPEGMKAVIGGMEADTMLKKLPLMTDIANVTVFLASDMAAKITGVTVDVTGGTTSGLNYRVSPLGPCL
jgi:3-oxoacyl-[acyl-carrier protein] reductase